jgi:hypothetical protein
MHWTTLLSAALLVFPLAARADDAKKEEPKAADLPITAKLVAKKATYTLDLDGKSAEDFQKEVKAGEKTGKLPKPPEVDLALELTNTTDKEVQLWISGDPVQVALELKGTGAVSVAPLRASTREFRVPKAMTLAPGKTHTIPITSLTYGFRGNSNQAYWTEAGEYTLTAKFNTAISPAPKDSKEAEGGFGRVTLKTEPIKLKVEAKK